ncbi:MAG: DUF1634 domain-containing protein [Bacteroidetes bacterium]|nr:DUF1634 domain-containing protein [Bacteroidota bacterium]
MKNESNIQKIIGNTLRLGVWISFFISLIGVVFFFLQFDPRMVYEQNFPIEPIRFSMIEIILGLKSLDPNSIVMLGIVIMLLTPLLRVFFALYIYQNQRNTLYVIITILVLIVITLSFFIGNKIE